MNRWIIILLLGVSLPHSVWGDRVGVAIDDSTGRVIRRFGSFIRRESRVQRKPSPEIDSFVDRDRDGINDLRLQRAEERSLFKFLNKIAEDYLGKETQPEVEHLGTKKIQKEGTATKVLKKGKSTREKAGSQPKRKVAE